MTTTGLRMITSRPIITAALSGALALAPQPGVAQQFTRRAPITSVSAPVTLDTTGLYLERAARVGEDIFVTGQPTERALRELREQGGGTISTRTLPQRWRSSRMPSATQRARCCSTARSRGGRVTYGPPT